MARPLLVGLTGPAGAGKSSVLQELQALGAAVLDADEVVHHVLASDADVIAAVARRFGADVVTDGGVDRPRMARRVFSDPEALRDLEALVHPAVSRRIEAWLAEVEAPIAVVEAVKLVEAGLHEQCDAVWLVNCDRHERRRRLIERGWSPDEVERRFGAAPPLAPELAVADIVIDNSGPPAHTRMQVRMAWKGLT